MDATSQFSLRVEQTQGAVVWVSGDVDLATAPILRDCLQDLGDQVVTLDFAEVTFLDSSGLEVLVWQHNAGGMVLRGVRPAQMKIFAVTSLDAVFDFVGVESRRSPVEANQAR